MYIEQSLNLIYFFLSFSVVAFMMNLVLDFMPKMLGRAFWSYPLCTVIEGLLKLPDLHTIEMQCENNNLSCEMTPECCCEYEFVC